MIFSRMKFKELEPLDILAAFFGYIATAGGVPDLCRKLALKILVPDSLEKCLLSLYPQSDFWYLVFFTVGSIIFLSLLIIRKYPSKEDPQKDNSSQTFDDDDYIDKAIESMNRMKRIRIIRSFGLVWLRELILDLMKVALYGTFKRSSEWTPEPKRFDSVDRISYESGFGIEYQYSKNLASLHIRTHPEDSDTYSLSVESPLKFKDFKLLIVASNFFPWWYLGFMLKWPYRALKRCIS